VNESTVSIAQAATDTEAVLPVRVQEALGELVGAAKEGLLALSVGVGLGVLAELLEEEVDEVVGPSAGVGARIARCDASAPSAEAGSADDNVVEARRPRALEDLAVEERVRLGVLRALVHGGEGLAALVLH
jgi:hypothetical protein